MFIYGRLAAECGYTRAQIDAMTLPQVYEQFEYWADYPPARDILAAVYQVKPRRAPASEAAEDIAGLVALAPGGFFNPAKLAAAGPAPPRDRKPAT